MPDVLEFLKSIDFGLFHLINITWANSFFDILFPTITDLHFSWQFKYVLVPFIFGLMIYFRRAAGAFIFFGWLLSNAVSDKIGSLLKHAFERHRPFEAGVEFIQRSNAGNFSFPSNHATNMFCMFFFLSSFFPKYRWYFFTVAALVSYSRIYDGVHFPSDVLGGAVLGSFFGYFGAQLTKLAINKFETRRARA